MPTLSVSAFRGKADTPDTSYKLKSGPGPSSGAECQVMGTTPRAGLLVHMSARMSGFGTRADFQLVGP